MQSKEKLIIFINSISSNVNYIRSKIDKIKMFDTQLISWGPNLSGPDSLITAGASPVSSIILCIPHHVQGCEPNYQNKYPHWRSNISNCLGIYSCGIIQWPTSLASETMILDVR